MSAILTCVVNDKKIANKDLKSEHGLSIWIETDDGILLFDIGQTENVLLHNLSKIGLNPQDIQAVVLSHAHYDHTGGLSAVIEANPAIPIFAHTDIFQPRFSLRDGKYQSIGIPEQLRRLMFKSNLKLSSQPEQVFSNLWTSGEIVHRPELEGRSANHFFPVAMNGYRILIRTIYPLYFKRLMGFMSSAAAAMRDFSIPSSM